MRTTEATIGLLELVQRLLALAESAPTVPLTGKVLLDRDDLLALLEALREAIPVEVEQAARLSQQREQILSDSRDEAEAVVREARSFAAQLTDETAIAREAQARADEVIDQSKRVAREIRLGARAYAEELVARLEASFEQELQMIRGHRQELNGGR